MSLNSFCGTSFFKAENNTFEFLQKMKKEDLKEGGEVRQYFENCMVWITLK